MTTKIKRSRLKLRTVGTLLIVLSALSACKPENPFVFTPISNAVELGETETVFDFSNPFVPSRQVNIVCFTFEQEFERDSTMKPPRFSDGVQLVVENTLVDDKGNKYELNKLSDRGGNLVCYVPEDFKNWLEISKKRISFLRLKVRVNRPLKVLKIEWKSYDAWDLK